jgi:hypothetical protein
MALQNHGDSLAGKAVIGRRVIFGAARVEGSSGITFGGSTRKPTANKKLATAPTGLRDSKLCYS